MPPDPIEQALDAALDLLARGYPIADCLDRFPLDAVTLRPLLIIAQELRILAAGGDDPLISLAPAQAIDWVHLLEPIPSADQVL